MCLHIVVEDGRIFNASLFTVSNIQAILSDKNVAESSFWEEDLVIVRDLSKSNDKKNSF